MVTGSDIILRWARWKIVTGEVLKEDTIGCGLRKVLVSENRGLIHHQEWEEGGEEGRNNGERTLFDGGQ